MIVTLSMAYYCAVLFGYSVVCLTAVVTFNIDVHAPILREGKTGSSFGFSLLGHSLSDLNKGIVIGSPKSVPNGEIFWCASDKTYCQPININVTDISRMPHEQTGALFGYSMASLNSMIPSAVSVCAPRIIRSITATVYVSGGCFSLNERLEQPQLYRSTLSMCESIPNSDKIMDLRHCTMGATVGQHRSSPDDLFLGGPYFYYAKGIGSVLNLKTHHRLMTSTDGLLPNDLLGSAMDISDKIYAPKAGEKTALYVAYGAPGVPTLAVDKPYLGTGSVWIFPKHLTGDQTVLTPVLKVEGREFGSHFGHSLILLDINADGWDDLLVGAPYQKTKTREGGHPRYGAVSIFLNQQKRYPSPLADTSSSPLFDYQPEGFHQVLVPKDADNSCESSPLSAFGATVTALGDINHDGYQDFAVGAPYGDKGGVVFIYHGSATGRIGSPTQVICAYSLSTNKAMQGFGLSVGLKGMDIDSNGYPDLAIGAPLSDSVVILRTRPIVRFSAHLVLPDGSTVFKNFANNLVDCSAVVQSLTGNTTTSARCIDLKLRMTYSSIDGAACQDNKVYNTPVLLKFNPTVFWLTEDYEKATASSESTPSSYQSDHCPTKPSGYAPQAVYQEYNIAPIAFLNEKTLAELSGIVNIFFPSNKSAASSFTSPSSTTNLSPGGYLQIYTTASCLSQPSGSDGVKWSSSELRDAPTIRLIVRNANLVDQLSPLSIGVKWFADMASPYPAAQSMDSFPVADPRQNHQELKLSFENECSRRHCCTSLQVDYNVKVTRDKHGPVVYVGDDNEQAIEFTAVVRNTGSDPAYTVNLLSSYSEDLLELDESSGGARNLRPDVALCSLTSPLMPGTSTSCTLRWSVVGHHLTVQLAHFYINSTVTSGTSLQRGSQDQLVNKLRVNVKMVANVSVTGLIEPNVVYFRGNVSDGISSILAENQIGDVRLSVKFTVRNLRKHSLVPSSSLIIDWPYEFAGDINEPHGKYMLYLLEAPYVSQQRINIPGAKEDSSFTVTCDSRALKTLVNPHKYRVFSSLRKKSDSPHVRMAPVDPPESHNVIYPPLLPEIQVEPVPDRLADAKQQQKRVMTNLTCYNGLLRCVPIVCDLGKLSHKAGPITLEFSARLWDNTMRDEFQKVFLTKLMLSATWRANVKYSIDLGDSDHAYEEVELQILNNLEPKPVPPKYMVLYISLAVGGGLLLLAVLILILYKAGFFKRKRFMRRLQKSGAQGQKTGDQKLTYHNPPEPHTQPAVRPHHGPTAARPAASKTGSPLPAAPRPPSPHGEIHYRKASDYRSPNPSSGPQKTNRSMHSFY